MKTTTLAKGWSSPCRASKPHTCYVQWWNK